MSMAVAVWHLSFKPYPMSFCLSVCCCWSIMRMDSVQKTVTVTHEIQTRVCAISLLSYLVFFLLDGIAGDVILICIKQFFLRKTRRGGFPKLSSQSIPNLLYKSKSTVDRYPRTILIMWLTYLLIKKTIN